MKRRLPFSRLLAVSLMLTRASPANAHFNRSTVSSEASTDSKALHNGTFALVRRQDPNAWWTQQSLGRTTIRLSSFLKTPLGYPIPTIVGSIGGQEFSFILDLNMGSTAVQDRSRVRPMEGWTSDDSDASLDSETEAHYFGTYDSRRKLAVGRGEVNLFNWDYYGSYYKDTMCLGSLCGELLLLSIHRSDIPLRQPVNRFGFLGLGTRLSNRDYDLQSSFFYALVDAGKLKKDQFSLCFWYDGGMLNIGGYKREQDIPYYKYGKVVLRTLFENDAWWWISIDNFYTFVGFTNREEALFLHLSPDFYYSMAALSIATPSIYLPGHAFDMLLSRAPAFRLTQAGSVLHLHLPCDTDFFVAFNFQKSHFQLSPAQFIDQNLRTHGEHGENLCFSHFATKYRVMDQSGGPKAAWARPAVFRTRDGEEIPVSDQYYMLGAPFLRAVHTTFRFREEEGLHWEEVEFAQKRPNCLSESEEEPTDVPLPPQYIETDWPYNAPRPEILDLPRNPNRGGNPTRGDHPPRAQGMAQPPGESSVQDPSQPQGSGQQTSGPIAGPSGGGPGAAGTAGVRTGEEDLHGEGATAAAGQSGGGVSADDTGREGPTSGVVAGPVPGVEEEANGDAGSGNIKQEADSRPSVKNEPNSSPPVKNEPNSSPPVKPEPNSSPPVKPEPNSSPPVKQESDGEQIPPGLRDGSSSNGRPGSGNDQIPPGLRYESSSNGRLGSINEQIPGMSAYGSSPSAMEDVAEGGGQPAVESGPQQQDQAMGGTNDDAGNRDEPAGGSQQRQEETVPEMQRHPRPQAPEYQRNLRGQAWNILGPGDFAGGRRPGQSGPQVGQAWNILGPSDFAGGRRRGRAGPQVGAGVGRPPQPKGKRIDWDHVPVLDLTRNRPAGPGGHVGDNDRLPGAGQVRAEPPNGQASSGSNQAGQRADEGPTSAGAQGGQDAQSGLAPDSSDQAGQRDGRPANAGMQQEADERGNAASSRSDQAGQRAEGPASAGTQGGQDAQSGSAPGSSDQAGQTDERPAGVAIQQGPDEQGGAASGRGDQVPVGEGTASRPDVQDGPAPSRSNQDSLIDPRLRGEGGQAEPIAAAPQPRPKRRWKSRYEYSPEESEEEDRDASGPWKRRKPNANNDGV